MRFDRISADTLLGEIRELPADSIDEVGHAVLARVDDLLAGLRRGKVPPTARRFGTLLAEDPDAGQKRGRALEDEVEALLKTVVGDAYVRGRSFTGRDRNRAKADFAVPAANEPKIVIECKGFEATGSKLTDVLGDIEKILEAKGSHMYCFVVTDGQGWLTAQAISGRS